MIELFAFPLLAVSFAMFALLWTSSAPNRSQAATLCYWLGVPLMLWGAFHFSHIAGVLNQRAVHYPSVQFEPQRPHIEEELILWFIPALFVCIGLKLSNKFGNAWVAVASVSLSLLNPTILLIGIKLRLPVSL